jgi:arylsulfatase A-like enzyme
MFTGLYTCVHGSVGTPYGAPLAPYAVPLAEYLRTAGYSTAAVAEDVWLEAATFVRGFEFYRENRDSSNPDRSRQTIEWAVDWLHRQATAPFFLFVHTYQAHEPYFAPPQIRAAFGLGPELLPVTAPTEPLLAQYDAAVTYTDTKLAPLLAALDDLGLRERTIVVATSDHGEAFREHGYVGHGRSLHEEVLRVPMIWRAPGLVGAGRRVEGQVSLIDLTPTLLDLLGVPPGGGFQGISLAPSLRAGGPENAPGDRVLFSENTLEFYRLAIRTPGWKALLERGTTEIFHLDRDPGEHSPDAPEALVAEAAQKAAAFEQECARRKTRLEQAAAGRPVEPAMPPDPDLVRRLKALGYTERETTR